MQRHDLLFLTPEGAARLEQEEPLAGYPEWTGRIPAILCMQRQRHPGAWEVGFSLPLCREGQRVRRRTRVEQHEILRAVSPWEAGENLTDGPWGTLYCLLRRRAAEQRLALGVYGSAALEQITGFSYLRPESDLDLLLSWDQPVSFPGDKEEKKGREALLAASAFCRFAWQEARKAGISLDLEMRIPGLGDVKAAEWFSGTETVLVRRLWGVSLERREPESIRMS